MARADRADWSNLLEKNKGASVRRRSPELQETKRAALAAETITGDKHWDMLLSIFQEKLVALRTQLKSASEPLLYSDIFDVEKIITQKLTVRLVGKEIETLEWVIGLPKELMEKGDQATELLKSIDEKPN